MVSKDWFDAFLTPAFAVEKFPDLSFPQCGRHLREKRWWPSDQSRVHLHFTPTYASWLNLVERFFGLLTEKALKRGSHTSIPQLREAILTNVDAHNEHGKPFRWLKTADEILDTMRRFGIRTQQVHGQ